MHVFVFLCMYAPVCLSVCLCVCVCFPACIQMCVYVCVLPACIQIFACVWHVLPEFQTPRNHLEALACFGLQFQTY